MTDYREVKTTRQESGQMQRFATFKAIQMIWLLLGILEAIIGLRVVFRLIGVNAANPFAALLYNVTGLFVAPFASLTGAPSAGSMVLEISSLIAMIVYLLLGWGLYKIVLVVFYRPRGPVSVKRSVVSEHTPQQDSSGTRQTTVTEESTSTQAPPRS